MLSGKLSTHFPSSLLCRSSQGCPCILFSNFCWTFLLWHGSSNLTLFPFRTDEDSLLLLFAKRLRICSKRAMTSSRRSGQMTGVYEYSGLYGFLQVCLHKKEISKEKKCVRMMACSSVIKYLDFVPSLSLRQSLIHRQILPSSALISFFCDRHHLDYVAISQCAPPPPLFSPSSPLP